MSFLVKWINWNMLRLENVDYFVIVNGSRVGPIVPRRGLKQGDPLSHYLLILCAEGLFALITQAENKRDIHVVKIRRGSRVISHFFADDCFLFFGVNNNKSITMNNILSTYR